MESDAILVERARRGHTAAADELWRRHQAAVYGYLLRMLGHAEDARDAAQETFLRAQAALGRYRERGRFKSWLFRIAHREGLKRCRDRNRHAASGIFEAEEQADTAPTPGLRVAQADERAQLRRAIEGLPEDERRVVALRIDEERTFREIAEQLAVPLGTVLGRMRRAVERLEKQWPEEP